MKKAENCTNRFLVGAGGAVAAARIMKRSMILHLGEYFKFGGV
ncbi:MAG: hypothetical protein ACLUKN_12935 [Bacilli bacterium]